MARANRRRVFRLSRRADQWRGACCISLPRRHPLAPAAVPAQSESSAGMDADGEARGRVPPQAAYPSPLAQCALCRQTPEVGAECPNWARSDLCGGRPAMSVPTASTIRPAGNDPYRKSAPRTRIDEVVAQTCASPARRATDRPMQTRVNGVEMVAAVVAMGVWKYA